MAIALVSEQRMRQLIRDAQELKQRSGIPPIDPRRPVSGIADGIPFYNGDSITIPPYSIVRVDNTVTRDDLPICNVKRPDTTFGMDYLVNGPAEVAAGELGVAQNGPLVKFAYNGSTPTTKTTYGPKPSQFTGELGFPALVRVIGTVDTTAKWAYGLLLSPITTLLGKATGSISGASSGTSYRIYGGTAGSESDCGFTTVPTAYNKGATAIANNDWVWLEFTNNAWYIGKIC